MTDGLAGSLENHAQEYFADAYGVYLTLGSLIDGAPRRTVLELLGQASTPAAEADEVLLSAFLLSTNAFFLARSPLALNKSGMFSGTHPPSVARINGIIQTVRTWCSKSRPALNAWTTQAQLEKILAAAAGATGRENWREQVAFLASPDGKEYYERLEIPLSKMMQPPSMAAT